MDARTLKRYAALLGDLQELHRLVYGVAISVAIQSEKGGWLVSLEKASYLCAYKCGVFPK